MPRIVHEEPEIVTISYHQTRDDADYGSCLWARFNFDVKHYHLSIESDCGSYGNGWCPTPDHETFLHLCSRFDEGYLLDKIDNRSVVDGEATYKALMEYLEDYDSFAFEELSEIKREELENACHHNRTADDAMQNILDDLEETAFPSSISMYDIACCIEMTYPRGAKKIAQIFKDYIQPELRMLSGYKEAKNT